VDPAEIVVVTGVPRSGTSLVMQMLVAAGVPVLADAARVADADNPRGYYEFEPARRLPRESAWVAGARGRAVKVVHALVPALPRAERYRVVLVRRAWSEVLASQAAMLAGRGEAAPALAPERLVAVYEAQLDELVGWARAQGAPLLELSHARLLGDPRAAAVALAAFLGGGHDPDAMARAVVPALHRQRAV
jgi:hypothetical protein